MRSLFRRRPSPALIISIASLFVALGGTSYAITVTGRTVKNNSLTGIDIKNNSLTSKDVRDRSLRLRDFRPGELPGGGGSTPGKAGAPGSALGYARVAGDGTVDPGASKNIALVQKKPGGIYCLNYTAGTATNAVATIDVGGADSIRTKVALTAVPAAIAPTCPASTDIVVATVFDLTNADQPFYMAVLG